MGKETIIWTSAQTHTHTFTDTHTKAGVRARALTWWREQQAHWACFFVWPRTAIAEETLERLPSNHLLLATTQQVTFSWPYPQSGLPWEGSSSCGLRLSGHVQWTPPNTLQHCFVPFSSRQTVRPSKTMVYFLVDQLWGSRWHLKIDLPSQFWSQIC